MFDALKYEMDTISEDLTEAVDDITQELEHALRGLYSSPRWVMDGLMWDLQKEIKAVYFKNCDYLMDLPAGTQIMGCLRLADGDFVEMSTGRQIHYSMFAPEDKLLEEIKCLKIQ